MAGPTVTAAPLDDRVAWWTDDAALAFAAGEQARILCERAFGDAVRLQPGVRSAHRALGLMGYTLSAPFSPELRHEILALIRQYGPVSIPPARSAREQLLMLAFHAESLVGRAATDPRYGEEMSDARGHAAEAVVRVTMLVGPAAADALHMVARAAGQLTRAWQQDRLLPGGDELRSLAA